VALSYVGSAFAVDCPPNSIDVINIDGDFDETTASDVSACYCVPGYMPDGNDVACVPCATTGTRTIPLNTASTSPYDHFCGGIAAGYFGTPQGDDTMGDATDVTPCAGAGGAYIAATQDHVTTTAAADATTTKADCQTKPGYYLATAWEIDDDSTVTAKVPANSYGAGGIALSATTDNSVNACPQNSNSEAGSVAIGDCKCDAGYKATTTGCASCPDNTDWITAPSIGADTFCEAIKAGYYGTLGSGADASPTACPSGWTSAGITSGGPTTIADCFQDASGIPPGSAMYGKSGDSNYFYCPTGTVNTAAPAAGTASFCSSLKPGYAGSPGTAGTTGSHATVTGCATGYYIDTAANFAAQSANSDASGLGCTQVPANKYFTTTTSNPLQVTLAETPTACPENSNSTAGSVAIGDCKCDAGYKATAANTCETCPPGTSWTTAPSVGTSATFCEEILAGYYGVYGNGADASPTACPENSDSAAGSTELADCECAANFYPSNNACVACATGTTREGTVSVTGTATCSGGAASPTTADSAGASTPIAVALATAAAVPLLL